MKTAFALWRSLILALVLLPGLALAQQQPQPGAATVRLGSSEISNYGKNGAASGGMYQTPAQKGEAFKFLVAGRDFLMYRQPKPTTPGRVEVLYFFWYGSDWAAKIDTETRQWAAANRSKIRFQPSAMVLRGDWAFGARIFFALELMGKEATFSPLLQQAIARGEVSLQNPAQVTQFLASEGLDAKRFAAAINDPRVVAKTVSAMSVARTYGLNTAPTFVIDGKYVFQASPGVSPENTLKMVQFFVQNYLADKAAGRIK